MIVLIFFFLQDSSFENLRPVQKNTKRKQKFRLINNSIPSINLPLEPVTEKKRRYTTAKQDMNQRIDNTPLIKNYNACCISSCENSCKPFYLFPSNSERSKEWKKSIKQFSGEDITNTKHKCICRKHFQEKYLTKKSLLTKNAIPTLFFLAEEDDDDYDDNQSETSDYNDVIETFNSSYPCLDDSCMMEANVEICETGEALKLEEHDNQVRYNCYTDCI